MGACVEAGGEDNGGWMGERMGGWEVRVTAPITMGLHLPACRWPSTHCYTRDAGERVPRRLERTSSEWGRGTVQLPLLSYYAWARARAKAAWARMLTCHVHAAPMQDGH